MNAITRIQEITAAIQSKLDTIQSESVAVGALLKEARDEMKEQGQDQKAFIAYCQAEFGIGKAQAFKLIKVSEVFGEDKRFNGVAMRVLYALASQANDEQLERAAEFAATGSLTTSIVNELLNPTPVQPEQPKVNPTKEEQEQAQKQAEEQQAAIDKALKEAEEKAAANADKAPFDADEASLLEKMQGDLNAQTETILKLTNELAKANELIKQLSEPGRAKVAAPFLPQFNNACPYAVLGLGQVESKQVTKVKKAFRDLIKCGYGEGHEAFALLVKAKDALLEEIEQAK